MLTKQQYYTKNRYFVAHSVAIILLIAAAIYMGKNGIDWASIVFAAIPLSVLVVSAILFPRAYKRYEMQEIAKQNGPMRYEATRTDMINTEEDD